MKISARNVIKGKVTKVTLGPISAQVSIQVAPKITVSAVISAEAAKELKLEKGKSAYAVIKASNVMVGID